MLILWCKLELMELTIELECEADGRWLCEVIELPGVMAYGSSKAEALKAAEVLALRVLADQLEHGEATAEHFFVKFKAA